MVALHNAAIPLGYKAGAIFWRDLWLAGKGLDNVRWWRNGANQLKASVDRVRVMLQPFLLHPCCWPMHACEKITQRRCNWK